MEDDNFWNCSASKLQGEKYYIEGLNIWDYQWKDTGKYFNKENSVLQFIDKIVIYQIISEDKVVKFGAIERSPNVYVIYTNYYQPAE